MKKVWIISYNLEGVTAGPSVRFQRYAPYFEKNGYRLVFVTFKVDSKLAATESREHFDIIRVSSNFPVFHNTLFVAKSLLKAIFTKDKPSIILSLSLTTFQLWLLPFIKLRNIKLALINTMSLHSVYIKGNSILTTLYNKIHYLLYGVLYRNINYIVGSSEVLLEGFKKHKVSNDQLKVIYNGVNNQRFHPLDAAEKSKFREKLKLPLQAKIVLFIGLKVERKGILDLIESWKLCYKDLPNHYLVMVGDEKSKANDQDFNHRWEVIKKEIENPELRIINRPNHPAVEEYFYAGDLFIFLSKKEGMPNVVLEAMSSGLPMILTAFEGFSDDYGQNGKEYLLVERNPEVIAETLKTILSDPSLFESIKSNATERIRQHFLLEKSIEKYTQIFDSSH